VGGVGGGQRSPIVCVRVCACVRIKMSGGDSVTKTERGGAGKRK